ERTERGAVLAWVEDDRGEQRHGEETVATLPDDADREQLAEVRAAERRPCSLEGTRGSDRGHVPPPPSGFRRVEEPRPIGVRGLAIAQDELLDHLARHVVAELHRRRLHEVGGRTDQRSTDPPVLRDLRAPERIDDDPCRIGRVPYLELHLDRQRDIAEVATLEPD